jgi:long-chain acyl-CoA synthetase
MSVVKPFNTLTEMFDVVTREFSDIKRPAFLRKIKNEWVGISYSDYRNFVKNFTLGLISIGIEKNDKIAIISENRIEWTISDISILALGAVSVPIYPSSTAKQIEYILNNAEVKYVIVSNQFQLNKLNKIKSELTFLKKIIIMNEKNEIEEGIIKFSDLLRAGEKHDLKYPDLFEKLLRQPQPDDTATIIYTSGTTGDPKGVELTHLNFVFEITNASHLFKVTSADISLSFLPLCHVFERTTGGYTLFASGATIAFADSIDTVAENMVEIKPTIITTVPRLFERIYSKIKKSIDNSPEPKQKLFNWALDIGKKYAVSKKEGLIPLFLRTKKIIADKLVFEKIKARTGGKIKFFVSGGAVLPKDIGEFFDAIGIKILEGYGLTETSPVIAVNEIDNYKFGSVGKPFPGVEVKIAEDGEILTRGKHVMKGYFKNPNATKEAINEEGWFHTGDVGHFDSENFLHITDRKKNIIVNSGGKNIAPQPIENLFLSSKFIDQFVLIGDRRQFLSALIVPDFDAIKEYADTHQIPYSDINDLTNNEEIYNVIDDDIGKIQRDLANYERVRKFVLLEKPLTLEDGEMTPTMKVKRQIVEKIYSNVIEDMYKSGTGNK